MSDTPPTRLGRTGNPITSSIDRRGFLRLAAVGAAAAGSGTILSACGSSGGSGGGSGSLTIQTFPTGLTPTQNVLKIYKQQYGRSASTVTVSGDYYTVTETRLLGGNPPFTTLDFDPGYLSSFAEKGWITDLEGLPGISQMKADMYPSVIKSLTGPDGKLYALPQYTNIYGFFYNEQILAKYGLKPVSDSGRLQSRLSLEHVAKRCWSVNSAGFAGDAWPGLVSRCGHGGGARG